MPQSAEEMTATFAGPPAEAPATELASLMKKLEMPVCSKNAPKMMNSTINVEHTPMGVPMTPSGV